MDILRERRSARRRALPWVIAVPVVVLAVAGMAQLRPAVPSVARDEVWIGTVTRGELRVEVSGQGTLVPEHIRMIPAETPGRVERKVVLPGSPVGANTILLELSNPDVQLELLQAEQQLSAARQGLVTLETQLQTARFDQEGFLAQMRTQQTRAARNLAALEQLAATGEGFISPEELQSAREIAEELGTRVGLETRRLEVMQAAEGPRLQVQRDQVARLEEIVAFQRRRIRSMQVRASIDGVLQEMDLEEGQWVQNGQTLARVVVPGRLKAELRIPQVAARDVALGQTATVDLRSDTIVGQVVRIDPAAQGGLVLVDVALPDDLPRSARPGLQVEGVVEISRLENVLRVERPALGQALGTVQLFRLVEGGGYAERVTVRLGQASVTSVEVLAGLRAGDQVILRDMSRWQELDRIRIKG